MLYFGKIIITKIHHKWSDRKLEQIIPKTLINPVRQVEEENQNEVSSGEGQREKFKRKPTQL